MRRSLLAIAVLAYAAFLVRYMSFGAGGGDSSGYLNAAHLISEGRLKIRAAPMDVMGLDNSWLVYFQPLGFAQAPEPKTLVVSYPLGYPLHLVPFGMIGGWRHAPFYVVPLCTLAALFVVYALARELGLDRDMAIAAAALLAVCRGWVMEALQPMSDNVATLWCAAAMLCAFRARRSLWWAAAAGASFGMAVWIRPTDALLAIALGFALRGSWRAIGAAAAAALPFGAALLLLNDVMYGGPLKSGYGKIGDLMSWATFGVCGPHHAAGLALTLTPLIFPAGLLVAFDRKVLRSERAALLLWFLPFYVFYSFYSICDTWWYIRFLMPTLPALVVGALLVMRDFVRRDAIRWSLVGIAIAGGLILTLRLPLRNARNDEMAYTHAIHWAEPKIPANALVASMQLSGAYYFYTGQLSVRYDWFLPDSFQTMRAYAGNAGLKWYALVFDWEVPDLRRRMPGKWTKLGEVHNAYLLRLDD